MKTFKILGALLDYPEPALIDALPELVEALDAERLLKGNARRDLDALFSELSGKELMALQEGYVSLFDRSRASSLHLFEHVHGESRDRGQALVDLRQLYARHGFALAANELPDYVPAFLEFLAQQPLDEARALLADTAHILEALAARLTRRGSAYGAVLRALLALTGEKHGASAPDEAQLQSDDDTAALDELWEETPAFGPGSGCGGTKSPEVSVLRFHRGAAR